MTKIYMCSNDASAPPNARVAPQTIAQLASRAIALKTGSASPTITLASGTGPIKMEFAKSFATKSARAAEKLGLNARSAQPCT